MIDWDERYATKEYVYGTAPNDFLRQHVERLRPGRTLCLAEGEGRNAVFLVEQGHQVTAIDASRVGLDKARQLAERRGVEIDCVHCDLAEFGIDPGAWDNIVSIFCHVPPELRERLHRAVVEGLKPGGILLLEAYMPRQIELGTGGPPIPELTMTLERLKEELDGLDFVHAAELERDVIEGIYHTGRGAVVQVIARKPGDAKDSDPRHCSRRW
ncbi:MAG: class I SAM-dependent methyltransferase [Gammaproteobacteria bacterium]|nr:MAG: class I SAM-dependent methyltransferase [Gammaproteobacteria bacterium]